MCPNEQTQNKTLLKCYSVADSSVAFSPFRQRERLLLWEKKTKYRVISINTEKPLI